MLDVGAHPGPLVGEPKPFLPRPDRAQPAEIIHVGRDEPAELKEPSLQAHLRERDLGVNALSSGASSI
jgi:hypothetical protein